MTDLTVAGSSTEVLDLSGLDLEEREVYDLVAEAQQGEAPVGAACSPQEAQDPFSLVACRGTVVHR